MPDHGDLPGCIYRNGRRWWWKVRLPGEAAAKARPLKAAGQRVATADYDLACELARQLWHTAQWQATEVAGCGDGSVAAIMAAYLAYARKYYATSNEPNNIRYALEPLIAAHGTQPAAEFGPLQLKSLREQMITSNLARTTINRRIGMIKRAFRWAASEQMIPAYTYQSLATVENLHRGRCGARETPPVRPVDPAHVAAVLPFAPPTVAAMLELQLLTGMRSGELVRLRPADLDRSGAIWFYRPAGHKTAWRGHARCVPLGPRGQDLLRPFLDRPAAQYCFTPAEACAQRGRPLPAASLQDRYDKDSYRHAVRYAIVAARRAITEPDKQPPFFTPHQLRHTAATRARRELGLDAARALLGHRHLAITDDYADLDAALAAEAAHRLG